MSPPDPITAAESPKALSALNRWLGSLPAQERVRWALGSLPLAVRGMLRSEYRWSEEE